MKNKKLLLCAAAVILAGTVLMWTLLIQPAGYENECRSRVFEDMKENVDVLSLSVIGILPRTEKADGTVSYGGGGTGVIFRKDGSVYYAVTAAHVISDTAAQYKVYTQKTKYETIDDPSFDDIGIEVVDHSFYESLADVKTEYISPDSDIAIISFTDDEELSCAEFEETLPAKGDRIVCLGHPDGRKLTVTYGTVQSALKTVTMADKATGKRSADRIMEHNAYLNSGSSGGPAFSENGRVCGLSIGGAFTLNGRFRKGFMIPHDQLQECIRLWEGK